MTTQALTKPQNHTQRDVPDLISSAAAGLVQMFDPQKQLFCNKMLRTERGMVQDGISHRYTLITLMGLHRLEVSGQPSPIAIRPCFDALLKDTAWIETAGDLGLLLWLCALVSPERLPEFLSRHDLDKALNTYPDGRERRTMELSWILSGLAHAVLARPEQLRDKLTPLASRLYAVLKENRGTDGIFGHQAQTGGLTGMFRGRLGSFADQVYPIYAFAWAAKAFQFGEALNISNACAGAICRAQGSLGQWWWHYDSKSGSAVGRYPVYSVHQHGMGPLALFALEDTARKDFTRQIYLGLEWIYGHNELRADMRDASASVIWRCIRPAKSRRYLDQTLSLLMMGTREQPPRNLHILHECWPYELGWLLYAFAGRHAG